MRPPPPPHVTYQGTQQQTIKHRSAKDRLNFVQKCYDQYPDLTMRTSVPELWVLYNQDTQFIRQEIAKRPNAESMLEKFNALSEEIEEKFPEHHFSFFDYTAISKGWAIILRDWPDSQEWQKFKQEWFNADALYRENQKSIHRYGQLPNLIGAPGLFMPHVAPTGALPIPVMNEGMALVTSEKKLGTVTFLGVGTNEELSFDGLRNQDVLHFWQHDLAHAELAARVHLPNPDDYQNSLACLRFLRQKIEEISDKIFRAQVELAFFMFFHEAAIKINEKIGTPLFKKLTTLSKKNISTEDDEVFQYETWIQGAKSLGLACPGEDVPAQYISFLGHLRKGYEFLLEHAETYDAYQENKTAFAHL